MLLGSVKARGPTAPKGINHALLANVTKRAVAPNRERGGGHGVLQFLELITPRPYYVR